MRDKDSVGRLQKGLEGEDKQVMFVIAKTEPFDGFRERGDMVEVRGQKNGSFHIGCGWGKIAVAEEKDGAEIEIRDDESLDELISLVGGQKKAKSQMLHGKNHQGLDILWI